ncbi:MAG TPA: [protein-PII] uridylyltransferase [Myxococcota bacterium]|nr:[protein-PII] uridylyltransferase [Myxococcota bacterium]
MRLPGIEEFLPAQLEIGANGRDAGFDVPGAVRRYLQACRAYLGELHATLPGGERVNTTHSDLIDRLIRRLFRLSEESYFGDGGEGPSELCVAAVGGYARREMSIHSDVDLLFLYRDHITPHVAAVAERLQLWLWDAQVTVGGATRTIHETIDLAANDQSVATSVLAPRHLAGSGVLYHQFVELARRKLLDRPERFVAEIARGLAERHTRYGDTLYLLQPNLKEGAGGLRDYHAACWAMQASGAFARERSELLHQGLLTEEELADLSAALDFLWRVRNELHLRAGRKNDQLSFELQEAISQTLGFAGGDDEHDLPVERFMGEYYRHARTVRTCSDLVMEQCLARVRRAPSRRKRVQIERGLRIADGQLEIPHARQLREDPVLLLDVFAIAQKHDVPLTRKALRLVRENLRLIDADFRSKPEAVEAFLRVLRAEHHVTRSLIAMNEVGLLGRFLPEWEHIVNRWQQVVYHTYTVDVHSIFLVEELRRLYKGDYKKELPALTELIRDVPDLTAVYLGCLFHDIGKGLGGDHSPKGAVRARACMERMGLDPELVERVVFLVDQHLVMSHLAQRRDLSDARLIVEFARLVRDRTNLRNLYLLTVADVRASSKRAWTDWKGTLLRELFERTSEFLETGEDDLQRAADLIERRVETRQQAAAAELAKQGADAEQVQAWFESLPRRYFTAHSPSQIVRHAQVGMHYDRAQTLVTAVRSFRGDFTELILCTRDVHGLFSNVAGVISAHHINILGAHVYTTKDGLALEVYRLTTPPGGEDEHAIVWHELRDSLVAVLRGERSVDEILRRRGRPVRAMPQPWRKPEIVSISNEESDFYTIVDVAANDRLGLLHDLTRVIADHDLEIYISKASSVLDQVADTFYLKDREGRKIHDPDRLEALQRDLLAAAQGSRG